MTLLDCLIDPPVSRKRFRYPSPQEWMVGFLAGVLFLALWVVTP